MLEVYRDQIKNAVLKTVDGRGKAEAPRFNLIESVQPMLHIPLKRTFVGKKVSMDLTATAGSFVQYFQVPISRIWMVYYMFRDPTTTSSRIDLIDSDGNALKYSSNTTSEEFIRFHIELGPDMQVGMRTTGDVNDASIGMNLLIEEIAY